MYNEIVLTKELGSGAFGKVSKGLWNGSEVAVKQILHLQELKQLEEFLAEFMLMRKLRPHANVVKMLGKPSFFFFVLFFFCFFCL